MTKVVPKTRTAQAPSWRAILPIHPAAELLPRMSDPELRELGEDIKRRGLQSPVSIFIDTDGVERLLDGINRLDAMEMAGITIVTDGDINRDVVPTHNVQGNTDPHAYVLSANLYRRHLTNEQKRELIGKVLELKPNLSNRQIAEMTRSSHPTVADVRVEKERRGKISTSNTRTDTKGREQPAKKSKPPKVEQKVFDGPQEAHSVVETPEIEEEEKPTKDQEKDSLAARIRKPLAEVWALISQDKNWPPLDDDHRNRRNNAVAKFGNARTELLDLATPDRPRGRPRKTVEA